MSYIEDAPFKEAAIGNEFSTLVDIFAILPPIIDAEGFYTMSDQDHES